MAEGTQLQSMWIHNNTTDTGVCMCVCACVFGGQAGNILGLKRNIIPFLGKKKLYLIYLKGRIMRQKQRKRSPNCWFTLRMSTTGVAGPG